MIKKNISLKFKNECILIFIYFKNKFALKDHHCDPLPPFKVLKEHIFLASKSSLYVPLYFSHLSMRTTIKQSSS